MKTALIALEMNVAHSICHYYFFKTPYPVLSAFWKVLGCRCRPCKPSVPRMGAVCGSSHTAGAAWMKARSTVIPAGSVLPCFPAHTLPACCAPSSQDGTGRCRAEPVTSCMGVWQVPPPGTPSHAVPWEVCRLSQSQLGVLQG